MLRTLALVLLFSVCTVIHPVFGGENGVPVASDANAVRPIVNPEGRTGSTFWQKIWGQRPRDALFLGMWSIHLDGSGEYFGTGDNNDQQYLIGMQISGLAGGRFINSHMDRCWYFGPSREVYSRYLSDNTRFDIGHKFGLLYGYGDDLPNIAGMSVFWEAFFSLSWKRVGIDLGILPTYNITANFRIDID